MCSTDLSSFLFPTGEEKGKRARSFVATDTDRVHNRPHNCISPLIGDVWESISLAGGESTIRRRARAYLYGARATFENPELRRARIYRPEEANVSEIFTDGRAGWSRICRKIDQRDSRPHPAHAAVQLERNEDDSLCDANLAAFRGDFRR